MKRIIQLQEKANSPWTLVATLAAVYALLSWAQAHPGHRLNCEDLGRCNLRTGEVLVTPFTRGNAVTMVSLYNDDGAVP